MVCESCRVSVFLLVEGFGMLILEGSCCFVSRFLRRIVTHDKPD